MSQGAAGPAMKGSVPPGFQPCLAPWNSAVVYFSGEVFACNVMCFNDCANSLLLGDLKHESLGRIRRGERARAVRRGLLDADLDGICCSHCDKSYVCNPYGSPQEGLLTRAAPGAMAPESAGHGLSLEPLPIEQLELGITDLCNMGCIMCSYVTGQNTPAGLPTRGFMPLEIFQACLDGAAAECPPDGHVNIHLHWIGEPLIHPEFPALLDAIEAKGERFHLRLITNGIRLDATLTERLLRLPGYHSLGISLNALRPETYERINNRPLRERVYRQALHFLDQRQRHGLLERWAVAVSAVVLRENLEEYPDWVAWWQRAFAERGAGCELIFNGVGPMGLNQINILAESGAFRVESRALYREALRRMEIPEASWPSAGWAEVDAWVLSAADAAEHQVLLDKALERLASGALDTLVDALTYLLEVLPHKAFTDAERIATVERLLRGAAPVCAHCSAEDAERLSRALAPLLPARGRGGLSAGAWDILDGLRERSSG